MITENTHKLVTVISFDRIERGFSLIGDFFDNNDNFITYASYNNAFELRSLIFDWQEKTIYSPWNKATFTTYANGKYEIKTWWDEDFQKSLH